MKENLPKPSLLGSILNYCNKMRNIPVIIISGSVKQDILLDLLHLYSFLISL